MDEKKMELLRPDLSDIDPSDFFPEKMPERADIFSPIFVEEDGSIDTLMKKCFGEDAVEKLERKISGESDNDIPDNLISKDDDEIDLDEILELTEVLSKRNDHSEEYVSEALLKANGLRSRFNQMLLGEGFHDRGETGKAILTLLDFM